MPKNINAKGIPVETDIQYQKHYPSIKDVKIKTNGDLLSAKKVKNEIMLSPKHDKTKLNKSEFETWINDEYDLRIDLLRGITGQHFDSITKINNNLLDLNNQVKLLENKVTQVEKDLESDFEALESMYESLNSLINDYYAELASRITTLENEGE